MSRGDSLHTFGELDQSVHAPASTITLYAYLDATGWTLDDLTITVDDVDYAADLGTLSIEWDASEAANPSEHYMTAIAHLHRYVGEPAVLQNETLDSTAPQDPPPGDNSGDGRAADFIIASLKLHTLTFNSPITLLRDSATAVPVPQMTWDTGGDSLTVDPVAYVRNSTPNFTFELYDITGTATMGYTIDMSAYPHTADPDISLYSNTTPIAFTSPATVTAMNPLLNKVCAYNTEATFQFYVKFTLPDQWSGPIGSDDYGDDSFQLYGVLATPTAPMGSPWVQVVADACNWAEGTTAATAATTALTTGFYDHSLYDYRREWDTTGNPETFFLGDFLWGTTTTDEDYTGLPPMTGECNDFADFLVCLSNGLGARPLKAQKSSTKNPPNGFWTNPVSGAPVHGGTGVSVFFYYHQFGNDTTIFDAAVRWHGITTPADVAGPAQGSDYFTGTVDTAQAPYVWNPLTPFTPIIANHRP